MHDELNAVKFIDRVSLIPNVAAYDFEPIRNLVVDSVDKGGNDRFNVWLRDDRGVLWLLIINGEMDDRDSSG